MKQTLLFLDGRVVVVAALAAVLGGCGLFSSSDPQYKNQIKGAELEVPPDLSQLQKDDRYAVPEAGGRTASASQAGVAATTATPAGSAVLPASKVAHIERAGNERWLVVSEPPEKVFPIVKEFWVQNGFKIDVEDKEAGIIETAWTEDRARMPKTGLRALMGRFGDSLFDTGERDRYRVRLERTADGTEIYVSQHGAVEILNASKDGTTWEPRPNDPGLEAQYLQKLLVRFGVEQDKAAAAVAAAATAATPAPATAPVVERARLVKGTNGSYLEIDDNLDRAWRRVGLALDRSSFTVESRDKAAGRYSVRYIDPNKDKEEPGFFARVFGGAKELKPQQYRVSVQAQGAGARVTVQLADGAGDKSDSTPRILELLHDELK